MLSSSAVLGDFYAAKCDAFCRFTRRDSGDGAACAPDGPAGSAGDVFWPARQLRKTPAQSYVSRTESGEWRNFATRDVFHDREPNDQAGNAANLRGGIHSSFCRGPKGTEQT